MKIKFIVIILAGFLYSCSLIVSNDIVDYKYSPDGKYIAISYIRNAGATTAYSVHTSIIKSYKIFINRPGNIFRGNRSTFIRIHWKDKNTLIIEHASNDDDIFLKNEIYENIFVEYIYNIENERYYGNSIDYKIPKGSSMNLPRDKYGWVIEE